MLRSVCALGVGVSTSCQNVRLLKHAVKLLPTDNCEMPPTQHGEIPELNVL